MIAFPPGELTVGHDAIRELYDRDAGRQSRTSSTRSRCTTLISGDLALTATPAQDEAGVRAQVVRRQPDGTWLRVLDRPDFTK